MELVAADAFNYLLDVQSKANPVSLNANSQLASVSEFVHFRLDEYHLLVPIHVASEVLLDCSFSKLPDAEPWLVGIANNRGRLITLVDLECLLLEREANTLRGKRVIVVEYENNFYGFFVNQVYGVMQSTALQLSGSRNGSDYPILDNAVDQEFRQGPNRLFLLNLSVIFQEVLSPSL